MCRALPCEQGAAVEYLCARLHELCAVALHMCCACGAANNPLGSCGRVRQQGVCFLLLLAFWLSLAYTNHVACVLSAQQQLLLISV